MPAETFTLIQKYTLTSDSTSVTFSSIPQTYTDLHFEIAYQESTNYGDTRMVINSDVSTASDYAAFFVSSTTSGKSHSGGSITEIWSSQNLNNDSNKPLHITLDVVDYRNTNKYKTFIQKGYSYDGGWPLQTMGAVWRGTSAITNILFKSGSGSPYLASGSIIALYGLTREP